jgi:hypothetical protein
LAAMGRFNIAFVVAVAVTAVAAGAQGKYKV